MWKSVVAVWTYLDLVLVVVNDKEEILNFTITTANVDDREPLKNKNFLKDIFGKLFADKGYISKKLENILFVWTEST
ncbi:MAG: transposase [Leeuwenhoekiella marinoflava]